MRVPILASFAFFVAMTTSVMAGQLFPPANAGAGGCTDGMVLEWDNVRGEVKCTPPVPEEVSLSSIKAVSNSCMSTVCIVECGSGYRVISGGYGSYGGENIDYNGYSWPPRGGVNMPPSGWQVVDNSWQWSQDANGISPYIPLQVMAICVKTHNDP